MIDVAAIIAEIKAGLPNESDRLTRAASQIAIYRNDFGPFLDDRGDDYESPQHQRTEPLMNQIIVTLTKHLYARGPAREIQDNPDLSGWLNEQYQREGLDGLLQEADRLALAGDFAAIQVVGPSSDDDPIESVHRPVRFILWGADQFVAWLDPKDPKRPIAVATLDYFDCRRRLRLYTAEKRYTFESSKNAPLQTSGGTAYTLVGEEDNYYGIIPFAYIHANYPATDFYNHGPGAILAQANCYLNHDLTDVGESLGYARKPVIIEQGNETDPPKPLRPGSRWKIKGKFTSDGVGIPASVEYLQPDVSFVEASWADTNTYIDLTMMLVGCPPSAVRLAGKPGQSGIAILVENQPLVDWATARQRPFASYEQLLALVAIAVGRAEYERMEMPAPIINDRSVVLDHHQAYRLSLRWPTLRPDVPLTMAEQTSQDASDLALGLSSRIKIIMRRYSMSREEAIAFLETVKDDLAKEIQVGLPPLSTLPLPQSATTSDTEE